VASSEIEKRKASVPVVDPEEEPSAEWGWHGGFPKATIGAGIFCGIVMFLFLIGNHRGNTENAYLVVIGLSLLIGVGIMIHRRRTSWRR
jgi:LPXTG-motif cell wall-anchored protein